ncbi:hypothetical protein JOD45_001354 [Scopulibacillus daqui]|uniref:Uncharacterized protein n=1 Tax=Scopulibacillus daqui TaxID=1469162 RepID=A0ABS2PYX2_9BACL|nr:hypothetical protein [Scopulibacillus daqui]MBM7645143.1 hypothetical protein [Scopulibacillus daqui]
MLQIQIGKEGKMTLKNLGVMEKGPGKIDFYYKNINEPAYIAYYRISLSFHHDMWHIDHFCVYHAKEAVYQNVGGLFSHILTDPLIEGLISYYHSSERRKRSFQDLTGNRYRK